MSIFELAELIEHLKNGKTIIYRDCQIKPTEENILKLLEMGEVLHSHQITDQMVLDTVGEAV